MTIYKLTRDFENYYSFIIKNTELGRKMPNYSPRFKAQTRIAEWVNPAADFYASQNYKKKNISLPDVTTWVTGNIVFNQAAFDALSDHIKNAGEFLPANTGDTHVFIFNTLFKIDKQTFDKTRSTESIDAGINTGLDNISFDDTYLTNTILFKASTDHFLHTYCTQTFKDLIKKNNLCGLLFEPV